MEFPLACTGPAFHCSLRAGMGRTKDDDRPTRQPPDKVDELELVDCVSQVRLLYPEQVPFWL